MTQANTLTPRIWLSLIRSDLPAGPLEACLGPALRGWANWALLIGLSPPVFREIALQSIPLFAVFGRISYWQFQIIGVAAGLLQLAVLVLLLLTLVTLIWQRMGNQHGELRLLPLSYEDSFLGVLGPPLRVIARILLFSLLLPFVPTVIQICVWASLGAPRIDVWFQLLIADVFGTVALGVPQLLLQLLMCTSLASRLLYAKTRRLDWNARTVKYCLTPFLVYVLIWIVSGLCFSFINDMLIDVFGFDPRSTFWIFMLFCGEETFTGAIYAICLAPFFRLFPARDYARFEGRFFDD